MDDSAGEKIDQRADEADEHLQGGESNESDESYLAPSRWWFASAAFPLIAGTLGPTASAFSICALVRPWRQRLEPGVNVRDAVFLPDPPWLTVVNAVQLVVALISNVCLLLNMTRRMRFSIAQPITIVGWYISAFCLLALTATASGPLVHNLEYPFSEHIWSQAFFYGIYATVLYFIDASLMVVTFWGATAGRYSKDFVLTTSQRTLMLQTITFLIYLLVGALVFSTIEDWVYLDGLYWADVTLFTVGFGDVTPSTDLGRALVMPYALVGIISLGLVIGSIRSMILERGKRRIDSRMVEKKRQKVVRSLTHRGNDVLLRPMTDDLENGSVPDTSTPQFSKKKLKRVPTNEFERRKEEFSIMRKVQHKATKRRRWVDLGISSSCWIILWLLGAYLFMRFERPYQSWSYFDAVYFSFISLVTIGYGDKSPVSNGGKSFFVFWSLLALPTMTVLISNAGNTVVEFVKNATLRLGNMTILPSEDGIRGELKYILKTFTGRNFGSPTDSPPQVAPWSDQRTEKTAKPDRDTSSSDAITSQDRSTSTIDVKHREHANRRHSGQPKGLSSDPQGQRSFSSRPKALKDLPTGAEYHYLLATEIHTVSRHLQHESDKQYSFEEWAWFLRLIGEDERRPETHATPRPDKHKKSKDKVTADDAQPHEERLKWSWVGNRNPLMGSQVESAWVLSQLTAKLKKSLSAEEQTKEA